MCTCGFEFCSIRCIYDKEETTDRDNLEDTVSAPSVDVVEVVVSHRFSELLSD